MEMTFHLENFEGPLDLLLHLISRNKVNIYDIPITQILAQYMAILEQAQTMDMEIAGEFITMAAQLVYIKSKMLLPRHEEEETEDPRAQLVEMLLEYQRIKEMTPYFRQRIDLGRDIFVKAPEVRVRTGPVEYRHIPDELALAARNMLEKVHRRMPPPIHSFVGIVGHETVSVSSRITVILKQFFTNTSLRFLSLFDNAKSRTEIVATFLAVLELSKTSRVRITGEGEDVELMLAEPMVEDA